MTRRPALLPLLSALALALAAGCGSPDFSYFESITSGPNPGATLILIWLSDSPADEADAVTITIERVELIGPDGARLLSNERRTVDLLTLQNGNRIRLAEGEVPAGNYERLRLTLASHAPYAPTIDVAGDRHPLQFGRAGAHVVDLPYVFHAPADSRTEIQLDFNVRLSVDGGGSDWTLTPQVDPVNPNAVGAVAGRVVDAIGLPIVGATVVARRNGMEIRSTRTAADGRYYLGLLLPGSYEVSLHDPLGPVETEPDLEVAVGGVLQLNFVR